MSEYAQNPQIVITPHDTFEGTVKPRNPVGAENVAQALKAAMSGAGTNEQGIIDAFGGRTDHERQEIRLKFKGMYGKDLEVEMAGELGNDFGAIVSDMLKPQGEYDATTLNTAFKGFVKVGPLKGKGTDEATLIEVMCSQTNAEMKAIKLYYKKLYGVELEAALKDETSGDFKSLLIALSAACRNEEKGVDMASVLKDVELLHKAGPGRFGTDESAYNAIMCAKSYEHIRAVCGEYQKAHNTTLENVIKSEFSGDTQDGHLTLLAIAQNSAKYFATQLHKSMRFLGTNDKKLRRIIIHRCEKDMVQIKEEYEKEFGKTLVEDITGDTSGDAQKMLLSMVQ